MTSLSFSQHPLASPFGTRTVFNVPPFSSEALRRQARDLSDRHSPKLGTRSLDLLHLAAAQVLECEQLPTFDARQAKAAKAERLAVRPG